MNKQTAEFDDLVKRHFYACQDLKRLRDELEIIEGMTHQTPGLTQQELGRLLSAICERAKEARSVVPPARSKPHTPRVTTAAELRQQAKSDTSCVGAFARARPARITKATT